MRNAHGQPEQATKNYTEEHVRSVTQQGINDTESKSKPEKYLSGYVEGLNDARTIRVKRRVDE